MTSLCKGNHFTAQTKHALNKRISCQELPLEYYTIIIISVLPKGRSFAANSDTKAAILPKSRSSIAKSGTYVAVLLGTNRCGSLPLLSASPLSLASEQTLNDLKRSGRDTNEGMRRVNLANLSLQTSPKFTTGVKYQFHQGF